jgi:hypothetical protein
VTELASHSVLADSTTSDNGAASTTSLSADEWKAEYDAQISSFRAQNAVQREKAERERARWEKIRAEEAAEARAYTDGAEPLHPQGSLSGSGHLEGHGAWESVQGVSGDVDASTSTLRGSPSLADARALVADEPQGHSFPPTQHADNHGSEHSGEHSGSDLPSSLTSSFPSDFDTETPPLERQHDRHGRPHPHASRAPVPAPPPFGGAAQAARQQRRDEQGIGAGQGAPPLEVTPLVFDSSLPTRTRALALVASLGINLLLPFVNGVMLGFGEIYAKEVIGVWLGWTRPGSSVATVGVRKAGKKRFWERKD